MIVFPTWKDGRFVRPDLFLSARAAKAIGAIKTAETGASSDNTGVFPGTFPGIIPGKVPCTADCLPGIRIIPLPAFDRLPAPVADHPDMLVYRDTSGDLTVYEGYYAQSRPLFDALPYGIRTIPDPKSPAYPDDVTLNCLNIRARLIGRCDAAHPLLTADLTPLPVKQGYTRCSTCMVGSSAAITADNGIADALASIGIHVLRIRAGHIRLPGYDCGFIGGATVELENRIGFFGDLSAHPDGEAMAAFIRQNGLEPVALCRGSLTDFGGGLLLNPT